LKFWEYAPVAAATKTRNRFIGKMVQTNFVMPG